MRMPAAPLAPYLRSDAQARLLALVLLTPDRAYSIAEIARELDIPASVAHKEVSRLIEAGVLRDARLGRARIVSPNTEYRLLAPLTEIIAGSYGPVPVLTRLLHEVDGIDHAFIYGSWADRYRGNPGPAPRDIDVVVIGDGVDRRALNTVADQAESALGIEVNITRVSARAWEAQEEPFIRTIRSQPLVSIDHEGCSYIAQLSVCLLAR